MKGERQGSVRISWGVIPTSSNHRRVSVGLKSSAATFSVLFLSLLVCRQAYLGDWQGEWNEAANTEMFRRGSSDFLSPSSVNMSFAWKTSLTLL